jgi:DNA-directed RNA polymerase specialized sigma subunit
MMTDSIEDTLAKYEHIIVSIARKTITGSNVLDIADLTQVGRLAAFSAIQSYDPAFGASMRTHVSNAVRRSIYDEAAKFIGPMTIADHVITSLASTVSKLADEGMDDTAIASHLSSNRLRWECTADYVKGLRFLYQRRHTGELSESLTGGDSYVTEDAIMRLLAQLDTTPLEHSIIYDRWLGDKTPESIISDHNISRRHFFRVQGELKMRLYDLLQDYQ